MIDAKVAENKVTDDNKIVAPLEGNAVALTETGDETFASEVLGKGIAIEPSKGEVYAPFDATVASLMGHAIGLEGKNGIELLIHIGIDTVKLEGKHYTPCCKEGQEVKAGDLLMKFDMDAIRKEGFSTVTPVIVTNADDFKEIKTETGKKVSTEDTIIDIVK